MIWVPNPPDNSGIKIDILPNDFDANGFCVQCGGGLEIDYCCGRCGADHWPAIKRQRASKKGADEC